MGADQRQQLPRPLRLHPHQEGKEKLRPALSAGNVEKTMTRAGHLIVAQDGRFYDELPKLFPHADAKSWFADNWSLADQTATRNGTLQGAYLILAARAVGLDAGPMSGFDNWKVDEAFLPAPIGNRTSWSTWAMPTRPGSSPARRGCISTRPAGWNSPGGAGIRRRAISKAGRPGQAACLARHRVQPVAAALGQQQPRHWPGPARSSAAGGRYGSPACGW